MCASDITLLPICIDSFCFIKRFLVEIGWWKKKKSDWWCSFQAQCYEMAKQRYHIWVSFFFLLILFFRNFIDDLTDLFFDSFDLQNKYSLLITFCGGIYSVRFRLISIDHGVSDYHITTVCMLIMSLRSFSLNVTFNSIWLVTVLLSYGVNQLSFQMLLFFDPIFKNFRLCTSINNKYAQTNHWKRRTIFAIIISKKQI